LEHNRSRDQGEVVLPGTKKKNISGRSARRKKKRRGKRNVGLGGTDSDQTVLSAG